MGNCWTWGLADERGKGLEKTLIKVYPSLFESRSAQRKKFSNCS